MTNIIIVIAVIAIIALLIVRSRQNKEPTPSAKAKSGNKNTKKTEPQTTATPVAEVKAKPSVDLNVLIGKIDLLISDKEYAKAEALINQSLKQDISLHPLYEKLLLIYHGQDDDFAVKQLLETLQKLNLNEVYQRIYNEHEAYKEEQIKIQALNAEKKSPDFFEYTPSLPNNSSDFDSLSDNKSTDNSLEFAQLSDSSAIEATPQTTLDFAPSTTESVTETPDLDFNITTPANDVSSAPEPTLDFKLDAPEQAPAQAETSLDFKLDLDAPVAEPISSPDFSLETSAPPQQTTTFDFSLDTPSSSASPTLDLNLDSVMSSDPAQPSIDAEPESPKIEFADANDPLVQSFSELTSVDPIDLHIELIEQYIRLGAFDAAKNLLNATNGEASPEQLSKIDGLLQKLAS